MGQWSGLNFFQGQTNTRKNKDNYFNVRFIWAAMKGTAGDIDAAYRERSGSDGGNEKIRKMLEMMASNLRKSQGAKAFCDQTEGFWDWKGKCLEKTVFLDGVPGRCGKSMACREEAALIAALRYGDSNACAASPLCGALATHKIQACEPYLTRASDLFCTQIVAEKNALEARRNDEKARLLKAKPKYTKDQPMQTSSPDVLKRMQAIEKGQNPNAANGKEKTGGEQ